MIDNDAGETMPLTSDNSGRDARGRFRRGNGFGQGRPRSRVMTRFQDVMLDSVSDETLRAVVNALVEKALTGDVGACKELLDRVLGKPVTPIISESVDPEFIETRVYFGPRLSREELAAEGVEVIGGPIDGSARVE